MKFLVFLLVLSCYSANAAADDSDEDSINWAVLVAGSYTWKNYRHQADVCHSYHVLVDRGIDPEHIIVMMYDDIANNEENTHPGQIFNVPNGTDVYAGVQIDYSGKNVSSETFLNILKGNATGNIGKGNERVLESTAKDNVFIYYAGHGDVNLVVFLEKKLETLLHRKDLHNALEYMHENEMYNKMLFYLESCESGSMFEELSSDLNVYAVTAANGTTSSWSTFCGPEAGFPDNCYADEFSSNWMKDSETHDINTETIGTQFTDVKNATVWSTVCQFGNLEFRNDLVSLYQGEKPVAKYSDEESFAEGLSMPSSEVSLFVKLGMARSRGMKEHEITELEKSYADKREQITAFVEGAVRAVIIDHRFVKKIMSTKLSQYTELECHANVMKAFSRCVSLGSSTYALKFSSTFANLCEDIKDETAIVNRLNEKCQNGQLFEDVI